MSSKAEKILDQLIEKTGGRYTEQKKVIITELSKLRHHFDIDDFIEIVRKKDKKASRATVYRFIKQLLEEGLLQKITTKAGKVYYEQNFSSKHHDHIICNHCGKIFELKENKIDHYLEEYCKKLNFIPDYRSLHIYGACPDPSNCQYASQEN